MNIHILTAVLAYPPLALFYTDEYGEQSTCMYLIASNTYTYPAVKYRYMYNEFVQVLVCLAWLFAKWPFEWEIYPLNDIMYVNVMPYITRIPYVMTT